MHLKDKNGKNRFKYSKILTFLKNAKNIHVNILATIPKRGQNGGDDDRKGGDPYTTTDQPTMSHLKNSDKNAP